MTCFIRQKPQHVLHQILQFWFDPPCVPLGRSCSVSHQLDSADTIWCGKACSIAISTIAVSSFFALFKKVCENIDYMIMNMSTLHQSNTAKQSLTKRATHKELPPSRDPWYDIFMVCLILSQFSKQAHSSQTNTRDIIENEIYQMTSVDMRRKSE